MSLIPNASGFQFISHVCFPPECGSTVFKKHCICTEGSHLSLPEAAPTAFNFNKHSVLM